MATLAATYRRFFDRPEALMIAVLVAAAITLIAAAVIGGRQAQTSVSALAGDETREGAAGVPDYEDLVDGPAVGPESTARTGGGGGGGTSGAAPDAGTGESAERVSEAGATREGVHGDYFEFGAHAPITFDGQPLNLAEDPITGLKGYISYVNRNGGINGLKIRLFLQDDRYTTQGGQQAADKLVKEIKPFIIEGTLGIDQIHKVAAASKASAIPYMAGGGPEPEFKEITDMYQIISNYDQYLNIATEFICKYGPAYVGGSKPSDIRLGTTRLNSNYIKPVEQRFVAEVQRRKCVAPVDDKARGTIRKPTEQTTYQDQMLNLRTAYANQGANFIIPLQDPITTARQTLEWSKSGYRPKWTIANFAHDGDVALTLFQGEWGPPPGAGPMRIMSGGCYYHPQGGGDPYNEAKCAKLGEAHRQWVSLGQVTYDENAGGDVGGHDAWNYNESTWTSDGGGGASGYQLVYFWHGAMSAIGTDPTREKFIAALNAYDNYSNLLTGPITFKGSPNTMIGATKFTLLEAMSNLKYRQVTDITPGLVDHF